MNDLLKITYENDTPLVSARELHEFLEVGTKFQDWFPRMCEYGFSEGMDFNLLKLENVPSQKRERTYSMVDYAIAVEMAKEISMIQRNEKGKQARQYFIQIEKNWNSPEKVMARALKIADETIFQLTAQTAQLEQRVSEYEPKIQYLDTILQSKGTLTVTQIAADYGLSAKMLNKILHDEHIQHNVGGQWILYKSHMSLGYTKSETFHFEHSNGTPDTNMRTRWTQKGRLLVHNILEHRGIKANMDRAVA